MNLLLPIFLIGAAISCGSGKKKGSKHLAPSHSPTEAIFHQTADQYKLPVRMIMAVAKLESDIKPEAFTSSSSGHLISPPHGETAFGLSKKELNLTEEDKAKAIESQIKAYGKWLSSKLTGLTHPQTNQADEKFAWLLQIASAHRGKSNNNLRSIFLMELIHLLNEGFSWQDPINGQIRSFPSEQPPIKKENLQSINKNMLELYFPELANTQMADFFSNIRGSAITDGAEAAFEAKGILINHCPFSLSACMMMQMEAIEKEDGVYIGSHYLIPQDPKVYPRAIQLSRNHHPVLAMGETGEPVQQERIVVTLVGRSGSLEAGVRAKVNPRWLTKWQLQTMGALIDDLCQRLPRASRNVASYEECKIIGKGVMFQLPQKSQLFQLGDLPDYDRSIFSAYLKSPQGLPGEIAFAGDKKLSQNASEQVKLTVQFQLDASEIVLQKLIRCPDQSLRWYPFLSRKIIGKSSFDYAFPLLDKGPNSNGQHYFRALVYGPHPGNKNSYMLQGWDMGAIHLSGAKEEEVPYVGDFCEE